MNNDERFNSLREEIDRRREVADRAYDKLKKAVEIQIEIKCLQEAGPVHVQLATTDNDDGDFDVIKHLDSNFINTMRIQALENLSVKKIKLLNEVDAILSD